MAMLKVHKAWEEYLHCHANINISVKSKKLDKFLLRFHELVQESKALDFSKMQSVSNILSGEFLVDVHRICSEADGTDGTLQLQNYLLHGRGCCILRVLNTIGVKGLSSGRELAELLLSILPLCLKFDRKVTDNETVWTLPEISNCFIINSHTTSQQRRYSSKFPQVTEMSNKKDTKSQSKEATKKRKLSPLGSFLASTVKSALKSTIKPDNIVPVCGNNLLSTSRLYQSISDTTESDSEDQVTPVKADCIPDRSQLGVFRGVLSPPTSENEVFNSYNTDGTTETEVVPLPDFQIDPAELCQLILSTVTAVCQDDSRQLELVTTKHASVELLPQLGQLLALVHEESEKGENLSDGWSVMDYLEVERLLMRTMLSAMYSLGVQGNGVVKLQNTGVLQGLVSIGQSHRQILKDKEIVDSVCHKRMMICSELNEGIFALVVAILKNIAVNPSAISTILYILKDYATTFGFDACQQFVAMTDNDDTSGFTKGSIIDNVFGVKLVQMLSSLITEMKKVKINYIHTVKCSKKIHKNCDYSSWMYHHHDILNSGTSGNVPNVDTLNDYIGNNPNCSNCMVAFIVEFLLDMLCHCTNKSLRLKVLASLEECGICCCVSPSVILKSMLADIEKQTPAVRNYTMTLLCRLFLEQCGGQKKNKSSSGLKAQCPVCEFAPNITDSVGSLNQPQVSWDESVPVQTNLCSMSDSAFSSGENSFQFGASYTSHTKWNCLKDLQKVVFSEDSLLSVQAMQHTLKLVCQGNEAMKMQLFQTIFIPVLASLPKENLQNVRTINSPGNVSEKVINYCLNSLPLLLQVKPVFHHFINVGGIKKLCFFLGEDVYRGAACKVFQMMVILEEKFEETTRRQQSEIANDKWLEIVINEQTNCEQEDYAKLLESETAESTDDKDICIETVLKLLTNCDPQESELEEDPFLVDENSDFQFGADDKLKIKSQDLLKDEITCDLWSAASLLLTHSQKFKRQFLASTAPHMAFHHLTECLKYIANCESYPETGVFDSRDRSTKFACQVSLLHAVLNVCLICQKNRVDIQDKQEMEVDQLLKTLKDHIIKSHLFSSGKSAGFKVLCDLLMSCSTGQYLSGDLVQSHAFSIMHLKLEGEVYADKDLQDLSEGTSSRDSEVCVTERGYEADSEFSPEERKYNKNKGTIMDEPKNKIFMNLQTGLPQPEFSKLVMDLLIEHHKLHQETGMVIHVLLKLITIAKLNPHNASSLYSQGLVELILMGFKHVLTSQDSQYEAEQRLLLDLFLVISKHSFLSKELHMYLQLFKEKTAPVELLLSTLTNLAKSFQLQPSYILCFPVIKSTQASDLRLSERSLSQETLSVSMQVMGKSVIDDGTISRSQFVSDMDTLSLESCLTGDSSDIPATSPLRCAPVELKLDTGPMWPGSKKSFSVALWIRLEGLKGKEQHDSVYCKQRRENLKADLTSLEVIAKERPLPPKLKAVLKRQNSLRYWTDQCLHLFSVGNLDLLLEVWIEPESYSLIFRLVSHAGEEVKVLTEGAMAHLFEAKKWHHLTLTLSEVPHGGKQTATISSILDGCYQKDINLEYSPGLKACSSRSTLYVGHSMSPQQCMLSTGSWQLGNLMFFKDCQLTKHTSFHLLTLGPNTVSLSQCDCGEQQSLYTHFITEHSLKYSGLSRDVFTGSHSIYMQHLRDNLVAVYTPQNATMFQQYSHCPQAPVTSNLTFSTKFEPSQFHLFQQPKACEALLKTDLAPQQHRGLRVAVEELGGIGVFLFLAAKVIGDKESSESDQAEALKLVFTLIHNNPQHYIEFTDLGGYAMLAKALSTNNCKLGYKILKVLLDACLTSSVINYNKTDDSYTLKRHPEAVIRDTHILEHILLAWKVWERASSQVWCMVFECLAKLVSTDHSLQAFNVAQLELVRIIEKLTIICLERIQDGYPSLPVQICECMLTVIQHVIGFSTDDLIHHVITVWDFLLLVHPAASAFVFHTPSDFYFRSKWGIEKKKLLSAASSFTSSMTKMPGVSKNDKQPLDDVTEEAMQFFLMQDATDNSGTKTKLESSNSASPITVPTIEPDEVDRTKLAIKTLKEQTANLVNGDVIDSSSANSSKRSSPSRDIKKCFPDLGEYVTMQRSFVEDPATTAFDADKDVDSTKSSIYIVDDHFKSTSPLNVNEEEGANDLKKKVSVPTHRTISTAVSLPAYLSKEFKPSTKVSRQYSSLPKSNITSLEHENSIVEQLLTLSETVEVGECKRKEYSSPKHWKNALNERNKKSKAALKHSFSVDCSSQTSEEDFARVTPSMSPEADVEEELPLLQTDVVLDGDTDVEAGLYVLCAGLAETLATILCKLPRENVSKIIGVGIIKPEIILVLAHHCSKFVRSSLIKLLDVYLHRAPKEQIDVFIKMHGFHLLANQLHQHKASPEIVEACFTILCASPFTFEDELNMTLLSEMSLVQKNSVVPILSLVQNSIADIALCHNIMTNLLKVFEEVPGMTSVLLDQGLSEVLCNVMHKLNAAPTQLTDLGGDERDLLWGDLKDFIQAIINKTFGLSGVSFYQHLEDMLHLLTAGESFAAATYGVASHQHTKIKTILCVALQAVLNFVDEKLESPPGIIPGAKSFSKKVGGFLSRLVPVGDTNSALGDISKGEKRPGLSSWDHFSSMSRYQSSVEKLPDKTDSKPPPESKSLDNSTNMSKKSGVHFSLDVFTAGMLGKKAEVSHGELLDRFKKLIALAVDVVLYSAPFPGCTEDDGEVTERTVLSGFPRVLASFLLRGIVIGMDRKSILQSLFWQTKDILRVQFSRLYVHLLNPKQSLQTKIFAVGLLANEFKCQEILKLIVGINYTGHKLEYYLYQLLINNIALLDRSQREEVEEIMKALQNCGFSPPRLGSRLNTDKKSAMEEDLDTWSREHRRDLTLWSSKTQTAKQRIFQKHDNLSKRVCHGAMEVTKLVSNAQAVERKKFLEHIKKQMTAGLQTKKAWQQLIEQLTHERAVWFDEKTYPQSWQLDPTEGPGRVRKRLMRCHLSIKKKFFLPQDAHKYTEDTTSNAPLSYLFEDDSAGADSRALIYKLHTSQNIQHTCLCKNVTPSDSTDGALLVGQNDLYFVADEAIKEINYNQVLLGNKDVLSFTIPNDEIKEIHKRWHQLRDDALEIFMMNGKTCLLSFSNTKERDSMYKLLLNLELPNLLPNVDLNAIQQLWLDRKITNYEYLTHLNKMAGRSYNDLMQYPVVPFVLRQYDDKEFNLEDNNIYRNLAKPIAVQHKSREQKYMENYKWLEQEKQRMKSNPLADPSEYRPEPYHYGSHYSNSGSILHFMVRLPPFTQMFLHYQDQSFDVPDRTFHSLATSWRLASFESTTDVKELVPEFFYLPEFLCNIEGFNFGVRQSGEKVNDVVLPKWCLKDPYLFIKVHRQILESDFVTQHLSSWIDLVFGYKQTGRPAIDAINVFHPATYFGVEVDKIVDPLRRNAVKTMIATYGQTPKQLFKSSHPPCTKSHVPSPKKQRSVQPKLAPLSTVKGIRWGNYVGSPDGEFPQLVWRQKHGAPICSLVALPTGEVFGLGPCSCLLVKYSKEKGVTGLRNIDVVWASIVSWGHPESVIRLKNKKSMPYINFMHWPTDEQVTCCVCVPDCTLLFFGSTSGVISVFNTKFNANKASNLQVFGQAVKLYGHSAAISCMYMCKAFSILVSASHDNTCIIWDLNRLNFVQCITDHEKPVHAVCVSDTLGDIASVSHTGQGSCLMLHTVNGKYLSKLETTRELIFSLAFSTAQEGRSVNAIVGGLSNGVIKMWSSWDLQPICVLNNPESTRPIVSLTYNQDNQRLFASAEDGKVMCWEKPGYQGKEIGFYPYL